MKRKHNFLLMMSCAVVLFNACKSKPKSNNATGQDTASLTEQKLPDSASFNADVQGKKVGLFTLKNKSNATVLITNYGGRLVSIVVPDKSGKPTDVILGYDSLKSYQKP